MTRTQLITLLRSTAASQETLHHVMHVWKEEHPAEYMQMEQLFEICCKCAGITVEEGKEKWRDRARVRARQLFCYTGRDWYSLKDMGEFLGGRDHTTALHARDTAKDLFESHDPVFTFDFDNLKRGIAGLEMKPLPVKPKKYIDKKISLIQDTHTGLYYRSGKSLAQNFGLFNRAGLTKVRTKFGEWRFKEIIMKTSQTKELDIV